MCSSIEFIIAIMCWDIQALSKVEIALIVWLSEAQFKKMECVTSFQTDVLEEDDVSEALSNAVLKSRLTY